MLLTPSSASTLQSQEFTTCLLRFGSLTVKHCLLVTCVLPPLKAPPDSLLSNSCSRMPPEMLQTSPLHGRLDVVLPSPLVRLLVLTYRLLWSFTASVHVSFVEVVLATMG